MQQIFGAGSLCFFLSTLNQICRLVFVNCCLRTVIFFSFVSVVSGDSTCNMQYYADLFKENHITGKRLLLLTDNDMRDMGVKSKGHVIHLKARHG